MRSQSEVRLIIETWNLGIGTTSATETAKARIKERLLSPTPELKLYKKQRGVNRTK
ncbi:MAG: hypothetical protein V7K38_15710 [Nostoc sp.]